MPAPPPQPTTLMEWSMEFWRRVLLRSEQVREASVETPSSDPGAVRRRDKDAPPDIW